MPEGDPKSPKGKGAPVAQAGLLGLGFGEVGVGRLEGWEWHK